MPLVKFKPISPGRRQLVKFVNPDLHKGGPYQPLVEKQSKKAGRNVNGHITVRHQGGGHKQHYRIVDFRRNKDGVAAKVERLEYDPNRSANLALLCYADGERRYIIAPKGLAAGTQLMSGAEAPIKSGNTLPLARRAAHRARRRDESDRPPAWRRRRKDRGRAGSRKPLGGADQGLQDPQEQAHTRHDHPIPAQETRQGLDHGTLG